MPFSTLSKVEFKAWKMVGIAKNRGRYY